jgi:hypothetical protein
MQHAQEPDANEDGDASDRQVIHRITTMQDTSTKVTMPMGIETVGFDLDSGQ